MEEKPKRPAPKTAWKKGQSGNPNGAPKKPLAERINSLRSDYVEYMENHMPEMTAWLERVAKSDPGRAIDIQLKLASLFLKDYEAPNSSAPIVNFIMPTLNVKPSDNVINISSSDSPSDTKTD